MSRRPSQQRTRSTEEATSARVNDAMLHADGAHCGITMAFAYLDNALDATNATNRDRLKALESLKDSLQDTVTFAARRWGLE